MEYKMYALISVWNKTGVVSLAQRLCEAGYTILSTGGTHRAIRAALPNASLVQVSNFTGFPEVLDGRVKTLHPKIHAGILARQDQLKELREMGLSKIDIVAVNLYPFSNVVKGGAGEAEVLENIDIGGHTLIRAAAKNYENTIVLTDPTDYESFNPQSTLEERRRFAAKAYAHVAEYDIAISRYFGDTTVRKYYPEKTLKYGCNPHQKEAKLCGINREETGLKVLQGNVGYINLLDALLGFQLVTEVRETLNIPAAASYKHTSPAGVGIGLSLTNAEKTIFEVSNDLSPTANAFIRARNCDPLSSFGDFVAVSDPIDEDTATLLKRYFSDGIIAPSYTTEALEILKGKKGGRYTIIEADLQIGNEEYREIGGVALIQSVNKCRTEMSDFENVPTSAKAIPESCKRDLILANITLKYTQSNSVAYAYNGSVIGIGAGQQNRVDCCRLAGKKAERWCKRFSPIAIDKLGELEGNRSERTNAMWAFLDTAEITTDIPLSLASDAFFPFPDSIEVAHNYSVKYVLQPGGSTRDNECVEACNKYGMAMAMSGKRMFLH